MGDNATHWEGVGRIPPHGGPQSDREETLEKEGHGVDILPSGGCDGRSGTARGGDLRILPPEHGCTAHFDQAHYESVSGGGAETGAKDIKVVVGTGRSGCGIDEDGGSGSVTDGGGEETDGMEVDID